MREILKQDQGLTGTLYGTHYDIRFTHKQMVPTPVLLTETAGDTPQV